LNEVPICCVLSQELQGLCLVAERHHLTGVSDANELVSGPGQTDVHAPIVLQEPCYVAEAPTYAAGVFRHLAAHERNKYDICLATLR